MVVWLTPFKIQRRSESLGRRDNLKGNFHTSHRFNMKIQTNLYHVAVELQQPKFLLLKPCWSKMAAVRNRSSNPSIKDRTFYPGQSYDSYKAAPVSSLLISKSDEQSHAYNRTNTQLCLTQIRRAGWKGSNTHTHTHTHTFRNTQTQTHTQTQTNKLPQTHIFSQTLTHYTSLFTTLQSLTYNHRCYVMFEKHFALSISFNHH